MPKDGTKIMPRRRRKDTKKNSRTKEEEKMQTQQDSTEKNLKNKMHTKNN